MIFDKKATIAEDTPFGELGPTDAGDGFDLQEYAGLPGIGEGEPIQCFLNGSGLNPDGVGPYQLAVYGDAAIDGNYTVEDMIITIGAVAINAGGLHFALPSNVSPFVKVGLNGFDAGTYSVRVVLK